MAQQQQNPLVVNAQLRQALLASAPRMRKDLGSTVASAMGTTTRVKLFNVGILTALQIAVTCPITIGTATATGSPKAPYNLINRLRVTDYDGTDRINMSGLQLFILNCIRSRIPYGYNNEGPITSGGSTINGGIITNPSLPTAVGNGTIQFLLDIPLAYDPEMDLRGAILAQTAVGEMYLNVDWNASLYTNGNLEAVYNGAPTTTVVLNGVTGPSIQVWQEYLLPQTVQGILPIPAIDLQTVYEYAGNLRSSDNLSVNAEKLINYPNVRSVIGAYFNYVNGVNSMLANDISKFRLIANANNILRDDTLYSQQIRQRNYLEGDIGNGMYWFLHRNKPIETALFGNVQASIVPTTVNASAYVEIGFESFYTKGSALPGMNQG